MQFENNNINEQLLMDLILKYFKKFASRNSSCFGDITKYLSYIKTEENQKKILNTIEDYLQNKDDTKEKEKDDEESKKKLCSTLRSITCYSQIELYFGLWMNDEETKLIERIQELYNKWHTNVSQIQKQEKTDETEADDLIIIAIHILLYLSYKHRENVSKSRDFIMDAIFLCELGIIKSKFNFRIKLYLLRLYCHPYIGCIIGAYKQFDGMKIRGVQYDSLSHILYHDASRYGFVTNHTKNCPTLHSEMTNHRREFSQANLRRTPQCFKYNNYHKAIEFAEFSFVMSQSEMFIISQADNVFSKLLNFYENIKTFPSIIDYIEAFIFPNHPYLKQKYLDPLIEEEKKQKDNDTEYEWNMDKWIDLNDYTTIPNYINDIKTNYFHKLIKKAPVSTLSNIINIEQERKS